VIRAPVPKLTEGPRTLGAETSSYLCRVLRLRAGDRFLAFDSEAHTEADGTIEEASPDGARVALGPVRPAAVVVRTDVRLVYALSKGDKVDAVVRDATELGATMILLAPSEHSVVRIDDSKRAAKLQRWERIAEEAARQSGRGDPPRVALHADLRAALAAGKSESADAFILDPRATEPLGRHLRARDSVFAVGPEGGFSGDEIELAGAQGYRPVTLGSLILRTETVAAAVLGALRVLESK
jgi:16S rRNA (uracil1498-N3)-methyltransferase